MSEPAASRKRASSSDPEPFKKPKSTVAEPNILSEDELKDKLSQDQIRAFETVSLITGRPLSELLAGAPIPAPGQAEENCGVNGERGEGLANPNALDNSTTNPVAAVEPIETVSSVHQEEDASSYATWPSNLWQEQLPVVERDTKTPSSLNLNVDGLNSTIAPAMSDGPEHWIESAGARLVETYHPNWDEPPAFAAPTQAIQLSQPTQALPSMACEQAPELQIVPFIPKSSSDLQKRGAHKDVKDTPQYTWHKKSKSCVRCRTQHIKCVPNPTDPYGPCVACSQAVNPKNLVLACLRYKITECTLYRVGKGPGLAFTSRWPVMKITKDINNWAAPEIHQIEVSSDVCPVPMTLLVRKFKPDDRDSLYRAWMDSKTRKKKFRRIAPYAIVNMEKTAHYMRQYIDEHAYAAIKFVIQYSDELVKRTYEFAIQYRHTCESPEERQLLRDYFRLWFGIQRTATVEHISGTDKLGMSAEGDESSFYFSKVALPPVMIQQLDMILTIGLLQPMNKRVLEGVEKLFKDNHPRSWLTIYLITFLTLHSCSLLLAENYLNARRHGLKRRFAIPNFIDEHVHSSNVLLSTYHFITNLPNGNPFKMNWKARHATRFSNLRTDEVLFINKSKKLVEERREKFQQLRETELAEDQLYFVSQMFDSPWKPVELAISFETGTRGNLPLRIYYGDSAFDEPDAIDLEVNDADDDVPTQ